MLFIANQVLADISAYLFTCLIMYVSFSCCLFDGVILFVLFTFHFIDDSRSTAANLLFIIEIEILFREKGNIVLKV